MSQLCTPAVSATLRADRIPSRMRFASCAPARAALVALPLLLTACSGTAAAGGSTADPGAGVEAADCAAVYREAPMVPDQIVVVVDQTASARPAIVPTLLAEQLSGLSRAGGSVSVVSVDGHDGRWPSCSSGPASPATVLATPRRWSGSPAPCPPAWVRPWPPRSRRSRAPTSSPPPRRPPSSSIRTLIEQPVDPRGDCRGRGMAEADRVWWLTDGEFTTGQLTIAPDGVVEGDATKLAATWGRKLPLDFKGRPLHVSGIAYGVNSYEPQHRQWLVDFTRGLCTAWKASGCAAIGAEPVAGRPEPARPGLPEDAVVEFPVMTITPQGTRGAADHGCRFTLPAALLFDGDSATLRPGAAASLRSTIDLMRRRQRTTAQIVGHTATDPGASAASMQRFSERRAQAVAAVLRSGGIAAARLQTTGVGDREPLAEDIDPATGRQIPRLAAAERRVDISIVGTGCPAP